jgi:hypothetical protein
MIAKNVGIRRARGRMVLSTNIDILFPDALMAFIARGDLDENTLYRTDRADVVVPFGSQKTSDLREMRSLRAIRVHRHDGTYDPDGHRIVPLYTGLADLARYRAEQALLRGRPRQVRPVTPGGGPSAGSFERVATTARKLWRLAALRKPHLNACGDFTMMSNDAWERVGGHAEWPMYSWNLDGLVMYQAMAHGIREVDLGREHTVLHMDHSKGSGWTPEGAGDLFDRMRARGIPVLTNDAIMDEVRRLGVMRLGRRRPLRYTPTTWGYSDRALEERLMI